MSTSSGPPETWISSFCSLLGHEYFAEVSEDFIEDDFNLTGLQSQVQLYKEALEVCRHVVGRHWAVSKGRWTGQAWHAPKDACAVYAEVRIDC